jgi:RNA-directed DNA polymerase
MQNSTNTRRNNHINFRRTSNNPMSTWAKISWKAVDKQVTKLQGQIYLARLRGDIPNMRKLQLKMINSQCNLIAAIRKVTSINRGKKTAGVDKLTYLTPERRMSLFKELRQTDLCNWNPMPVRRLEIPRPGKAPRPLGIPTTSDRVVQQVVKNALEPEWEGVFEHGSYGFRPARSSKDAMARIWRVLSSKKRKWVLDADIKGCFNNIAHGPLLEAVNGFPAQALIQRWLKAGYFLGETFHPTEIGTPQGGIISPLLANIALHGMESALKVRYHKHGYVRTECEFVPVRYADDFVVLCDTEEKAREAQNILAKWLAERGMEFSPEKTHIRPVEVGFDFLGWTFRLYNNNKEGKEAWKRAKGKLVTLVKPSAKSVQKIKDIIKEIFRKYIGKDALVLIKKLNPILRGWANYHRFVNSSETFRDLDAFLYQQLARYARRKHPKKSWSWIKARYFKHVSVKRTKKTGKISSASTSWGFTEKGLSLYLFKGTTLENYSSIGFGKNPLSPIDKDYFAERKSSLTLKKDSLRYKLLERQVGICPVCEADLIGGDWDEPLHVHHLVHRKDGGSDNISNLMLLHEECHYNSHKANTSKEALEVKLKVLIQQKK